MLNVTFPAVPRIPFKAIKFVRSFVRSFVVRTKRRLGREREGERERERKKNISPLKVNKLKLTIKVFVDESAREFGESAFLFCFVSFLPALFNLSWGRGCGDATRWRSISSRPSLMLILRARNFSCRFVVDRD